MARRETLQAYKSSSGAVKNTLRRTRMGKWNTKSQRPRNKLMRRTKTTNLLYAEQEQCRFCDRYQTLVLGLTASLPRAQRAGDLLRPRRDALRDHPASRIRGRARRHQCPRNYSTHLPRSICHELPYHPHHHNGRRLQRRLQHRIIPRHRQSEIQDCSNCLSSPSPRRWLQPKDTGLRLSSKKFQTSPRKQTLGLRYQKASCSFLSGARALRIQHVIVDATSQVYHRRSTHLTRTSAYKQRKSNRPCRNPCVSTQWQHLNGHPTITAQSPRPTFRQPTTISLQRIPSSWAE